MRELRNDMETTVTTVLNYDNRSKHHTVEKLNELMEMQEFSGYPLQGYPISGDALALVTQKTPDDSRDLVAYRMEPK